MLSIALLTVALAAGCGGSTGVTFSGGVIHVGVGVNGASLTTSILGISVGTPESEVQGRLGEPFVKVPAGRLTCWGYHADQGGSSTTLNGPSSLDGISFCMSPSHRVARIQLALHA